MTKQPILPRFTNQVIGRREFMVGAAAAGVLASTGTSFASEPKRGGTFRLAKGHGSTTDTLDPGLTENGYMIALDQAIHGYITEVDAQGNVIPNVAESWEVTPDAKIWTFKLRNGVTFHDGKTVTPKDVVASINHHRGEKTTSAMKPILAAVTNVEEEGSDKVKITLNSGNADFPFVMSDYHVPILPADEAGNAIWQSGVGCGPYMFKDVKTDFNPGVKSKLVRNPNYYKPNRAWFDAVEIITIADATARINALKTGSVDAIDKVALKAVRGLTRNKDLRVIETSGNQHYTFVMRTDLDPYTNNEIRLAMKYAIDREEIVKKILKGYGYVGNDHPIGRGQRYFDKSLAQKTYDPDKAKHHLKNAGVSTLDVELSAADAAFEGAVNAAILYSEKAKKAGINLQATRVPDDGYWSNTWLKAPFCAVYWGGRPTEDLAFSIAYAAGAAWNDAYWDNKRFNELLLQGRSELDDAKRAEIYHEMQSICSNDGGTIVPMFANYVFATSSKVGTPEVLATDWDMDGERCIERWWFNA